MPGSWESNKSYNGNVLIAVPHTGMVTFNWAASLLKLVKPRNFSVAQSYGMPYDVARNDLVRIALENKFQYIFFLDSDVEVPENCLIDLLKTSMEKGYSIVSGVYYKRSEPIIPCIWMRVNDINVPCIDYPKTFNFFADFVGAGCLLINTKIFETLSRPWFHWTVGREISNLSEDFYFLKKCRDELNIRPVVNPRIQCKHTGLFNSSIGGVISDININDGSIDRISWIKKQTFGRILDVGSNNGIIFDNKCNNVTRLDLDAYQLNDFVQGNAEKLPFKNKSFDCVVLGEILEHVNDPLKVMLEAKRVTRHKVVMTTPNEYEWDKRHLPLVTKKDWLDAGETMKSIEQRGTIGSIRTISDDKIPHLLHVRHYDEITLRKQLHTAFEKYELEMLRYNGWSFFCTIGHCMS